MSGKTKSRESFELRLLIFSDVSITEEGSGAGSVGAGGRCRRLAVLPLPPDGPTGDNNDGVTDRAALVET